MKVYKKRPRWTVEEREIIKKTLKDGTALTELVMSIPNHNEAGIIREVLKTNRFSIRTTEDGTRRFYSEVKTRKRLPKQYQTEATDMQTIASGAENAAKRLEKIIYEDDYIINLSAVDILRKYKLPFEPKIIYELSEYLIRSKKKDIQYDRNNKH